MKKKINYETEQGTMFFELLFLLFLGLKLAGKIDWSWWWVFSPLWLPIVAVLVVVLIAIIVGLLGGGDKK